MVTNSLFVDVDGVRLSARVSGADDAPTMVLLHALGEDSSSWDAMAARFVDRFRCIAFDLRGHGTSDWPGTYSIELMRDDVLGALDQWGLDRIVLVGHSMGGSVAYLIAEERPELVTRLVLEDTCPPYTRDWTAPDRPDGPLPFDWPVVPQIAGQASVEVPAWWERLADITAPTLLVAGGPDSHVPHDRLVEVAERIPSCTLVTIPAGHHVHEKAPAEFLAAVETFLTD